MKKNACTTHSIKESALTSFVLNDIRYHARLASAEHELLARELAEIMNKNGVAEKRQLEVSVNELQQRLGSIEKNIKSLYEEKCAGKLPESVFNSLINGYIAEQAELTAKRTTLKQALDKFQCADNNIEKWLKLVAQYKDITNLTRSIVYLLIDHIEVGKAPTSFDDVQEIKIVYRFIGNLMEAA